MSSCHGFRAIERHFAGSISREAERTMRAHVVDCDACRRHYQRHLVLEALTDSPFGAQQRLAIGLGFRKRSRSWLPVAVPALLALAALVVVLAIGPLAARTVARHDDWADAPTPIETAAMTARGGTDAVVGFRIRDAAHEPVGHLAVISASDELAFAYAASGTHPYLAVFGVDDDGRFYWYFPAWSDASTIPSAIHVAPSEKLVELSEAIRHDLRGHHLWIYTAFLDRPWTTVEIEARAGKPGGAIVLETAVEPRYSVEIAR